MAAKILLIDIETSPLVAYSWGPVYETNLIEVIDQSRILSFSAKWLNGKSITKGLPDYKGYKKGIIDDARICDEIHDLLNEADIVVAHNGRAYDVRMINARFLANGMNPPSPYRVIDTKTAFKRAFRLPSNSLDNICDYLGLGRKLEHEGFPLWKRCMAGEKKAWAKMLKYNRHDVVLLEQLYRRIFRWIDNHPNMGAYSEKPHTCSKCGVSGHLQSRGWNVNKVTRSPRYQCLNCGGWSSGPAVKIPNITIR